MKYWHFKIYYKNEAMEWNRSEWNRSEWVTVPEVILLEMPVLNSRTVCAAAWAIVTEKFATESTHKIELIATRTEARG